MADSFKTRFPPSPTGYIHIGNARTALFNYLFAQSEGGSFLLRIEDTDRERSKPEYAKACEEDLLWLGLQWDEGPGADRGRGPYYQSERQAIYNDYYERLLTSGQAYECFCSEEDLALMRKVQRASGKPPRYNGQCRHLTPDAIEAKKADGLTPVLRFRVPDDIKIIFDDLVRGEQSFESNDIGDFIIRRTDGTSPFMFCSAIDDSLMGVTDILRGEDHLTNTPRQLMILDALGLSRPTYGHIALIVGPDNSPLSKRHGSRSIRELRKEGYLPQAINNYMARLGHYYKNNEALLSFAELGEQFEISALAKSPAKFNQAQLDYWQKQVVQSLSLTELKAWLVDYLAPIPADKLDVFLETVRPNVLFPADLLPWIAACFAVDLELSEAVSALLSDTKKAFFQTALESYKTSRDLKAVIAALKEQGYKGKALFQPLRVALTGQAHGPELDKLMDLMDEALIEKRLDR